MSARVIAMPVPDASQRPVYAAIPARAITDRQLSSRHFRTLAAIAAHDRLGRNGIGCWASHERLAAMIGCGYTRLSTNIRELIAWGYIERSVHPQNKRLRIYRVVYNIADGVTMRHPEQWPPPDLTEGDDSSPPGQQSTADSSPPGQQSTADSSPNPTGSDSKINHLASVIYSPEGVDNIFRRSGHGTHSAEAAPPGIGGVGANNEATVTDIGKMLGGMERRLRRRVVGSHETEVYQEQLEVIVENTEDADPLHQWARRLLEEWFPS